MSDRKDIKRDSGEARSPELAYRGGEGLTLSVLVGGSTVAAAPGRELSELKMIELIRSGLSRASFYRIAEYLGITVETMCGLVHISPRTLQRKAGDESLSSLVSERAIDLARLIVHGAGVFGSVSAFQSWIREPRPALGGLSPLSLMDTAAGCSMVRDVLGRIEHGVYS